MQELYRFLWPTYPMCFSQLPSTFQTLTSKQRIIQGTISTAVTGPVLSYQYHRTPGAICSVFTTQLLCMVLSNLHPVTDVPCLSVCHRRLWRFLLTELKSIHVDLWIAHFLQCTNFSFFHLLTLFYNNVSVGFAPVYVPSCKSIWTDHVYFPVEGTLRTS